MRIIFKNATLLDGTKEMSARENTDIAVENGIITEIGSVKEKSGDKVYDLKGKYLMPGLINLHVHMPAGGKPANKPMDSKKMAKLAMSNAFTRNVIALNLCHGYGMQALMSGVTTVRAVGGLGHIDTKLRDLINSGKKDGPTILCADYAIGVEDGHMDGSVAKAAKTPEEAAEMVRELVDHKVDIIKLMITGGVMDAKVKGEPGQLRMEPEMIKAACDEAHKHGLKVAAHVQSPDGIRAAVNNGVDTIEHGSVLTEEEIKAFKDNGAAFICTLSPAFPMAKFERATLGISEAVQYNSNLVFNNMVKGTKTALENDIPVGLGTDTGCPYTTHYNMWRELQHFCKNVEVTPEFALYTATLANAKIAGIDKETGSIEVGKRADMVITEKNPLENFRNLSQPAMVVARGKVFDNPVIKKYPQADAELDKYMK